MVKKFGPKSKRKQNGNMPFPQEPTITSQLKYKRDNH